MSAAGTILEIDPCDLTLFEKVGSGSTAVVYRGIYRGEEVAVKEIQFNKQEMNDAQQRAFDREITILKQVNHVNLVRMIGTASMATPFQIVTDFCAGWNCFHLLHNCDDVLLTWTQKLKMITDVGSAMDYLHKFKPQIIHRDLKSLNLLLAAEIVTTSDVPLVKVSDFGLSRIKDTAPDAEWGKMTIAAGTCHWMAPEVFMGTIYDEKVDVYSYSMILFEFSCHEIPFEDEEPSDVIKLACKGSRPNLVACLPDTPVSLRDLMVACWSHEGRLRPSFDIILKQLSDIVLPEHASVTEENLAR